MTACSKSVCTAGHLSPLGHFYVQCWVEPNKRTCTPSPSRQHSTVPRLASLCLLQSMLSQTLCSWAHPTHTVPFCRARNTACRHRAVKTSPSRAAAPLSNCFRLVDFKHRHTSNSWLMATRPSVIHYGHGQSALEPR